MSNLLELSRIIVPDNQIEDTGSVDKFFKILDNSQNLTEEFLYTHQPITENKVPVYSTSDVAVGYLDDEEDLNDRFNVVAGPLIIVARKGYAGRLFVITDSKLIVHEDAYPVIPKDEYREKINLWWFAGHYSMEFQADRTSSAGIGDFPRERFKNKQVVIPKIEFQDRIALLYLRRVDIINKINRYKDNFYVSINEIIHKL